MLEILYQDSQIIAVNKPAGMLSVPGRGQHKQDSVALRIQQMQPEARVVHRLDCHTSGVMVMAVGAEAHRKLNKQFHDREVSKHYIAVVDGAVTKQQGEIDMPMRADIDNRPVQVIDCEHGKQAITRWQVIEVLSGRTRLMLTPVTGRTHQLRLHCTVMGHAIVGDRLYNPEPGNNEPRMLLHARSLSFTHPTSEQTINLVAPCDF